MTAAPKTCNPDLLERSLLDEISEQQEEWLAEHLDTCTTCQHSLARLAGDENSWSRIETILRDEVSGTQPASRGMLSTLVPSSVSSLDVTRSLTGIEVLPSDFAVEFLQPPVEPDSIGRLNDIEIRSVIGHGGNGIVLKGYQKELNRLVAVKVMAPQLATNAAARKRFAREAQATAAIVHPNVMPVLTVHSDGQLPYLVMPYVDCESLQQRLDREGSLPTLDVVRIAHQVARGLAAAHAQGLVHRDVKPANILLERGVNRVMLTDFGLARAVDDATLTSTGLIAGTPHYMSPEQARGESVSAPSDLFSLGSVMYAMSTGRPPFRAETVFGILRRVSDDAHRSICELNPTAPGWLDGIVGKLLEKTGTDRFARADDLASVLEDCVAHVQQPHNHPLPRRARDLAGSKLARLDAMQIVRTHWMVLLLAIAGTIGGAAAWHDMPTGQPEADSTAGEQPDTPVWDDGIDQQLQQLDVELDQLLNEINQESPSR